MGEEQRKLRRRWAEERGRGNSIREEALDDLWPLVEKAREEAREEAEAERNALKAWLAGVNADRETERKWLYEQRVATEKWHSEAKIAQRRVAELEAALAGSREAVSLLKRWGKEPPHPGDRPKDDVPEESIEDLWMRVKAKLSENPKVWNKHGKFWAAMAARSDPETYTTGPTIRAALLGLLAKLEGNDGG
ncbi:MAG: hypothetical protein V3V08_07445 [Nannocystaceae bacterium]